MVRMLTDGAERAQRTREDRRLFDLYQRTGDPAARAALTERFLPLARSLARRYERGGEPLDDLTQVASLALLKAIDRFDPTRAVAFSSFAVPTIVGELKRYFRDHGWSVRVPRDLQERSVRLDAEAQRLTVELQRAPTAAELADRLGVDVEQIVEARAASGARRAISLDRPHQDSDDDDGREFEVAIEDPGYRAAEDAATIWRLAAGLSACEREALRLRIEHDLTQSEIATRIGVSQMHVSRMLRRAVERMREQAEAEPVAA
jgi:RNA polymerase sigma-B factor